VSDQASDAAAIWPDDWPSGLYTLPPTQPLLTTLAHGLTYRCRHDPLALARITIMLPTRRACRAMRSAFLEAHQHFRALQPGDDGREQSILLPILRPIGDVDEDELILTSDDPGLEPLAPPIGGLERQLRLSRAIMAAAPADEKPTPERAIDLAAELARLLDQLDIEGVPFEALAGLVPDDYAHHWQEVLQFLDILGEHWPGVLAERGATDPGKYRDRWLRRAADFMASQRPTDPVIIAGSTGSIPATSALMRAVLDLPRGTVLLPGFDRRIVGETLPESHAQYQLLKLVNELGATPEDWPAPWPDSALDAKAAHHRQVLIDVLTGIDPGMDADPAVMDQVTPVTCSGPEHEAMVAALAMREVLEPDTPANTAMLVTPDRNIANRVAAVLGRYGITVNDSAGQALADTPVGIWLRLTAVLVANRFGPRDLLSVFKHPLAALGRNPAECRENIRLLEMLVLRGPRPAPGIEGLKLALDARRHDEERPPDIRLLARADGFVADLEAVLEPVLALAAAETGHHSLKTLITTHIRLAEQLAAVPDMAGAYRLWVDEAGEMAASFINDLLLAGDGFPPMAAHHYADFLASLMATRVVRPKNAAHPRLTILGLLEARLVEADRVILAGLNEGTWPPEPSADPWLSRPMRKRLGLPTPERRLGQTAHDFAAALGAPEVFLLRAGKQGGAPTIPARWMQYLDVMFQRWRDADQHKADNGFSRMLRRTSNYQRWAVMLDEPDAVVPIDEPAPTPAEADRPTSLSVTDVELLMRNPYGFYARHVLKLRALDDLELDPGAAERGSFIHKALDRFTKQFPDRLPPDAVEQLIAIGDEVFADVADRPEVHAFWWARFIRIANWFVGHETERREAGWRPRAMEVQGKTVFPLSTGDITLRGRADRIDRAITDNALSVIDYKTGSVPDRKDVCRGLSPQLAVEALIVADGGFEEVDAQQAASLEYIRLSGTSTPGEVKAYTGDEAEALITYANQGLNELLKAFAAADMPYLASPRPDLAPRYDDYRHLARYDEWAPGLLEGQS